MSKKTMKIAENRPVGLPVSIGEPVQLPPLPAWIERVKAPRTIQHCRKLLGRLISSFIRDEVDSDKARTVCYLLTSYVGIAREQDIEQRLEKIESQLLQNGANNETF